MGKHPLTLTLPLVPEIARLLIGLIADVILPRGSIDAVPVPELQTPFIFFKVDSRVCGGGKLVLMAISLTNYSEQFGVFFFVVGDDDG